jgi:outer membrane protein assembly factor BamB
MRRSNTGAPALPAVLGVLLLIAVPAQAVIMRLLPLAGLLKDANHVCVVKVEKLDPGRPAMVLTVEADLKDKLPLRRLPINLQGDREAKKFKQTPQMLRRLARDLPLVLFLMRKGEGYVGFGYTNGTWFQLLGQKDGDAVRWSFTHAEPYLRRTFRGTTSEMRKTVEGVLAGKLTAPSPDPRAEPGLGPEVKAGAKSSRAGFLSRGPLFAVIPTVGVGAPLALLAMLFPTVFGGLLAVFRRWAVLLTVVGTTSTLFFLYTWLGPQVSAWWASPRVLWTAITAITLVGGVWAWRQHLATLHADPTASDAPTRTEFWSLVALSVASLAGVGALWLWGAPFSLDNPGWKYLLLLAIGFWAGTLSVLTMKLFPDRRRTTRASLPTQGVILWAMVAVCAFLTTGGVPGRAEVGRDLSTPVATNQRGASLLRQVWSFQPAGRSDIASSPVVAGNHVYVGVIRRNAFEQLGELSCLDRETGKEIWRFDNGGTMKQMFSSPCVDGGKVYIGEGFHENAGCRLFCLDVATGKKVWDFETDSHTESSPCVVEGKVYFGAGDDGLYCLDAATGKKLWQYPEPGAREGLHIDASPTVVGGRVYCGSGVSRTNRKLQVFCLKADTGKPVWAMDAIELPAWGSPAVWGDHVYFGLGNGRLTVSDPKPGGAVLCLEAKTGRRIWRCDEIRDAIHARPAVDRHRVYVTSRDGNCYAIDRKSGKLNWKRPLGSPSASAPALTRCSCCGQSISLYVTAGAATVPADTSGNGMVYCLDPETGEVFWKYDELKSPLTTLVSSPAVEVQRTDRGDRRRVYVAAAVNASTQTVVRCLEDEWHSGTPSERRP